MPSNFIGSPAFIHVISTTDFRVAISFCDCMCKVNPSHLSLLSLEPDPRSNLDMSLKAKTTLVTSDRIRTVSSACYASLV